MSLMFPNQSRSYDATRRAVRFWGHDRAMEWSFFVTEDALKRLHPAMSQDESFRALAACIWNEMTVDEILSLDLAYAPPFAPVWDPVLIAARKAFDAVEADTNR